MRSSISNTNDGVSDDGTVAIKKILCNHEYLCVEDKYDWLQPKIGDRVQIVSWDTQDHVQECIRVSQLPYLTVKDINPMIVGIGKGRYAWSYGISVNETHLEFLQWHYKILN